MLRSPGLTTNTCRSHLTDPFCCTGSHSHIGQASLQLTAILLPQHPESWNYSVPLWPAHLYFLLLLCLNDCPSPNEANAPASLNEPGSAQVTGVKPKSLTLLATCRQLLLGQYLLGGPLEELSSSAGSGLCLFQGSIEWN